MTKNEIRHWMEVFSSGSQSFMTSGGEKINMYKIFEQMNDMMDEIEKLRTIRAENDYMVENIHIIDNYRVAQLVRNKYLIELRDGVFVDIHEVVRKNKEVQERIRVALDKIQLLIDIGFDYDGYNDVDNLKMIIDELVSYARDSRAILKGDKDDFI